MPKKFSHLATCLAKKQCDPL